MKTKELKDELLAWLSGVEDEDVLRAVAAVRDGGPGDGWLIPISSEHKEKVVEGIQDWKEGRVVEAGEFWNQYGK